METKLVNITPEFLEFGDRVREPEHGGTVRFVVIYSSHVSVSFSDGGTVQYPTSLSLTVEREA